jgi:hypothetical protein
VFLVDENTDRALLHAALEDAWRTRVRDGTSSASSSSEARLAGVGTNDGTDVTGLLRLLFAGPGERRAAHLP